VTTKRPPRIRRLLLRAVKGGCDFGKCGKKVLAVGFLPVPGKVHRSLQRGLDQTWLDARGAKRSDRRHEAGDCRPRLVAGFPGVLI
jgi:hypothetical protein